MASKTDAEETVHALPEGADDLPARIEETHELTDALDRIREATQTDGSLIGRLHRIHTNDEAIVVEVHVPGADALRFQFDMPKAWHPRYDFVRFVDHYADHPADIDFLVESQVGVELREVLRTDLSAHHAVNNHEYGLVYPEYTPTRSQRFWWGFTGRLRRVVRGAAEAKTLGPSIFVLFALFAGNLLAFALMAEAGADVSMWDVVGATATDGLIMFGAVFAAVLLWWGGE